MSTQHPVTERMQFLLKVEYDDVKHQAHFEWVIGYEKLLDELVSEVFDTLGVNDEVSLNTAIDRIEEYLVDLGNNMDTLVTEISKKTDVNEAAKSFATDWRDNTKHHISIKYHRMGDGPSLSGLRFGFTSPLENLTKCATHLASLDDGVEYKNWVSEFEKTVLIDSLVKTLKNLKSDLEARKNSSS